MMRSPVIFATLAAAALLSAGCSRSYSDRPVDPETGILNFAKVSDALYRGGHPSADGFARLKDLGVRTVVSLRTFNVHRSRLPVRPMSEKTHTTAVVLIPPEAVWEPIQAIRRAHDRQVRRWMPHVTLLYPFRPREAFDALGPALAAACRAVEPFEVTLSAFRHFSHGRRRFTLWLAPEPLEHMRQLQEALWRAVPDYDDVRRHRGGFTPHLSVGQVRGVQTLRELLASLEATWQPLVFRAAEVSLIWRGEPPDDVFRVDRTLPLGSASWAAHKRRGGYGDPPRSRWST